VCLPLWRAIGRSLLENWELVVVSLESNVDIFSPVCVSDIRIPEDVGTGLIEVHLVKTLIDSPNQWEDFGSPCIGGNIPRSISIDDRYARLVDPKQEKIYCRPRTVKKKTHYQTRI